MGAIKLRISVKITLLVFCVVMINTLLTFTISSRLYGDAMVEQTMRSTQKAVMQVAANLEAFLDVGISASNQFYSDSNVLSLVSQANELEGDFKQWYLTVASKLQDRIRALETASLYKYNATVRLYDLRGACYSGTSIAQTHEYTGEWFEEILHQGALIRTYFLDKPDTRFSNYSGMGVVITRILANSYAPTRPLGILTVYIQLPPALTSAFTETDGEPIFLLGDGGETYAKPLDYMSDVQWNELFSDQKESVIYGQGADKLYISSSYIYKSGWRVVMVTSDAVLFQSTRRLSSVMLWITLALTLVTMATVALSVNHTIHPLNELSKMMSYVGSGELRKMTHVPTGHDEVAGISRSYNLMIDHINDLIKRLNHEHALHERAMLETLRGQIHPHFILNTLNDIKWMANLNGDTQVFRLLATLGSLMETTLGRKSEFCELRSEIIYSQNYIKLQNLRFNDGFTLETEISEDTLDCVVPVLILQPLIENAIFHGIRSNNVGIIFVEAWQEKGQLVITVCDNGCGIPPEKLEKIRAHLNDLDAVDTESIGLSNVHKRIVLTYGREYGLSISSAPSQGCTVTLRFPVRRTIEEV